jgi:hypothetical protein
MMKRQPKPEPDVARIKVTGSRVVVEKVAGALERDLGAIRTSPLLPNDREGGVHIYLAVTEVRH